MTNPNIIVAIDGYSSTGKSTVAKGLAAKLQLIYIDSGAMYRAVALYALQKGIAANGDVNRDALIAELPNITISFQFDADTNASKTWLNGKDVEDQIRKNDVASIVSEVAAIPEVRRRLVDIQRSMAKQGGLVMDGRDIGTVVFPHADVKIFMTADEEIRVDRRYNELIKKGERVEREDVRRNLNHRDHIDTTRSDSPLKQADDAVVLNNSRMSIEEQLEWAVDHISAVYNVR